LLAIDAYISADNPVAAGQVVDYIIGQAEQLTRFPMLGRIPKPSAPRELIFTRYPLQPHLPRHPQQDQDCQSHSPVAAISVTR
jgi:plasmid stabilization system protein ParE